MKKKSEVSKLIFEWTTPFLWFLHLIRRKNNTHLPKVCPVKITRYGLNTRSFRSGPTFVQMVSSPRENIDSPKTLTKNDWLINVGCRCHRGEAHSNLNFPRVPTLIICHGYMAFFQLRTTLVKTSSNLHWTNLYKMHTISFWLIRGSRVYISPSFYIAPLSKQWTLSNCGVRPRGVSWIITKL